MAVRERHDLTFYREFLDRMNKLYRYAEDEQAVYLVDDRGQIVTMRMQGHDSK